MKKLFNITSHQLMESQIQEAKEVLRVQEIVPIPEELQELWSNIDPCGLLPIMKLRLITTWLKETSNAGDYCLVQGDFGAAFYIVSFCFYQHLIPLYATTKRVILKEESTDTNQQIVRHVFQHINFRQYENY
jgi:hypothetical protein